MMSIETHRAAIGRFTGKARYISKNNANKNVKWVDTALLMFLLIFFQIIVYETFVFTMISSLSTPSVIFTMYYGLFIIPPYVFIALLMIIIAHLISSWFIKNSEIKLTRDPSPPKGIKVGTLIPCTYLDTFVLDGRCNLNTYSVLDGGTILDFVLGGGDGKTRIIAQRLNYKVTYYLNTTKAILHHLCKMSNFKIRSMHSFV